MTAGKFLEDSSFGSHFRNFQKLALWTYDCILSCHVRVSE